MSKLTDYGTMVLAQLAAKDGGLSTAGQVAGATHLGQPTVSKLLKSLAHAGLVVSTRGVQGGYALARPADTISAAEIIDALEGPVAITECSSGTGGCNLESYCRVGSAWQRINLSIRKALEGVTLADLQQLREPLPPPDLQAGLRTAAVAR
ncbi:MAG TPA: SUF system Fe-S cluster assembly regulator [Gammaproteobacteria bacterium]|nr:SUF system Fe-S cluster assembly regulator [Gammaproteobacteria bacterium]